MDGHSPKLLGKLWRSQAVPSKGRCDVAFEEVTARLHATAVAANSGSRSSIERSAACSQGKVSPRSAALPSTYPCPVQVLRFGNELLLIALGGEPVVDYAVRLKTELAGPLVWVAGYSNDMFGYLPTRRVQMEGGYEGGRALLWSALPAPFTDTVEERILAAILDIVKQNA